MEELQTLLTKDGEPLRPDQRLDGGSYDVSIGAEIPFILRNPNPDWTCDISDVDTVNTNSSFHSPDFILPLESVEVKIKIKPVEEDFDNFDFMKQDIPDVHDFLQGNIVWKRYEITSEFLESVRKNQSHMKRMEKNLE